MTVGRSEVAVDALVAYGAPRVEDRRPPLETAEAVIVGHI